MLGVCKSKDIFDTRLHCLIDGRMHRRRVGLLRFGRDSANSDKRARAKPCNAWGLRCRIRSSHSIMRFLIQFCAGIAAAQPGAI